MVPGSGLKTTFLMKKWPAAGKLKYPIILETILKNTRCPFGTWVGVKNHFFDEKMACGRQIKISYNSRNKVKKILGVYLVPGSGLKTIFLMKKWPAASKLKCSIILETN